jgi:Tfp pilus assembly protein PilF
MKRAFLSVLVFLSLGTVVAHAATEAEQVAEAASFVAKAQSAFNDKAYKKCISYSKKALDRAPQTPEAYYWKARGFEAIGKPLEAANEYRAALLAKKGYTEAQDGLNRVTSQLGSATLEF